MNKTIDDVSRDELAELVEAMIDLMSSHAMLIWLNGKDDDPSHVNTHERARRAMESIGLPQIGLPEFNTNLEALLKSGKPI